MKSDSVFVVHQFVASVFGEMHCDSWPFMAQSVGVAGGLDGPAWLLFRSGFEIEERFAPVKPAEPVHAIAEPEPARFRDAALFDRARQKSGVGLKELVSEHIADDLGMHAFQIEIVFVQKVAGCMDGCADGGGAFQSVKRDAGNVGDAGEREDLR